MSPANDRVRDRTGSQLKRSFGNDAVIDIQVIPYHDARVETRLECGPAKATIETRSLVNGSDGTRDIVDNVASHSWRHDLWDRTTAECDDGCAARHRFNHDQPERFRPID